MLQMFHHSYGLSGSLRHASPLRVLTSSAALRSAGVCVAQILASATNYYAIDKTYNLRWVLHRDL